MKEIYLEQEKNSLMFFQGYDSFGCIDACQGFGSNGGGREIGHIRQSASISPFYAFSDDSWYFSPAACF